MGWNLDGFKDERQVVATLHDRGFSYIEISGKCALNYGMGLLPYSVHADKHLLDYETIDILVYISALKHIVKRSLGCKLVVHPPSDLTRDYSFLKNICRDITFAVENTHDNVFGAVDILSHHVKCGIALDSAHYFRLGIPCSKYLDYSIEHVHIRGKTKLGRYFRVVDDRTEILSILFFLKNINYKGPLILEYPYTNICDAIEDRNFLLSCFTEVNLEDSI